jgi:hypothetical protein
MISPCCRNPDTADTQLSHHTGKDRNSAMRNWSKLLIAAPLAAGLLAAPAYADRDHRGGWDRGGWHGDRGGWHGDRGWHRDHDNGGAIAGAVLGLGAAAIIGGLIASQQQPQYYAPPPPVVYAPPPPYQGPAYYPRY